MNRKKIMGIIIVVAVSVIGVLSAVFIVKDKRQADLARSQEAYLAQDLERLSGQFFISEYYVNSTCKALNNRYKINNTYFACRMNDETDRYEIYTVDKEKDIVYMNGSATRKTCTKHEEERAKEIEARHVDECICTFVLKKQ